MLLPVIFGPQTTLSYVGHMHRGCTVYQPQTTPFQQANVDRAYGYLDQANKFVSNAFKLVGYNILNLACTFQSCAETKLLPKASDGGEVGEEKKKDSDI